METVNAMAGITHPAPKAPHMKVLPITTCQQICRCNASALMSTHITAANPPNNRKAPDNAQVGLVFIEWGVMSSMHCSGRAPNGTMNPICYFQLELGDSNHRTGQLTLMKITATVKHIDK